MVRRLGRFLGGAAATLCLTSCQFVAFLLSTPFPATLTLATAEHDLSAMIPADLAPSFKIAVLETAGGNTFVVLSSRLPSSGPSVIFLKPDLSIAGSYTYADLGGTVWQGNGAMVDANGDIRVGSRAFNPASLALVALPPPLPPVESTGWQETGHQGFVAVSGVNTRNITQVNFDSPINQLSWSNHTGWAAGIQQFASLMASPDTSYFLDSVFADANPTGYVSILLGEEQSSGETRVIHFVRVPKTDFADSTVQAQLDTAYPVFVRGNMEPGSFGFAQGSLFGFDASLGGYIRIDPSNGAVTALFPASMKPSSVTFAYTPSGGAFYSFDEKSRRVTRYSQWW